MTEIGRQGSITTDVVRRVIASRRRRDWRAVDLAARCAFVGFPGLNRSVLANLESGRRNYLTVDELAALATVFDLPAADLLTGGDDYVQHDLAATYQVLLAAAGATA